jgi:hypothetical protein
MCGARFLEPLFNVVFGLRASGISFPPRSRNPGETWGTQFVMGHPILRPHLWSSFTYGSFQSH